MPKLYYKSMKLHNGINFCKHYRNHGFGAVVNTTEATFRSDWYGTDAYMLEVIYYERMQQYACLTTDASNADLFYIPFFAGLDALPYLYRHDVKAKPQGRELVAWLAQNATETWARYGGRDHFYVAGRTAWDFSRRSRDGSAWGTTLYANPELENVSSLVLERRPWRDTELAIPYPVGFQETWWIKDNDPLGTDAIHVAIARVRYGVHYSLTRILELLRSS
jgi:hypothetical protein